MLNNVLRYTVQSRRRVLTFAILLVALVALPAFAVQNPNINLRLNSSFNGYTVETSANGMEVHLVGVHQGTSKSSGILIGMQQVSVTLSNKKQVKRSVSFEDGKADFGTVEGDAGTKVSAVSVIAPMY